MRKFLLLPLLALPFLGMVSCRLFFPKNTTVSPVTTGSVEILSSPLASKTAIVLPTVIPTKTPTNTRTHTPTKTPTHTRTHTPTNTLVPATSTSTAFATSTAISVDVEPQPAGKEGPWLIFACSDSASGALPTFTDGDGNNCTRFALPVLPNADQSWDIFPAPRGGYIAFRVYNQDDTYNPALNGIDNYLWILKLPENQIVRKIPLVDEASWEQAHTNRAYGSKPNVAPPMAVMYSSWTYLWSPDGRYLAFSASANSANGLDLLLYDTLSDEIIHLTGGRYAPAAYTWSPDGNWIVYSEIEECYYDGMCRLDSDGNLYAISLQGIERLITQEDGSPTWDIAWTSGHSMLFANAIGMNPAFHLYSIDLETNEFRSLYDGDFWRFLYFPPGDTIVIYPAFDPSGDSGARKLSTESGTLSPYTLGGYEQGWRLFWNDKLQRITADRTDPVSDQYQVVALKPDGQLVFMIQNACYIIPSPNGMWFTVDLGPKEEVLYDSGGQAVTQLYDGNFAWLYGGKITLWRSDSSAFYAGIEECQTGFVCVVRYDQNNSWKQVSVGKYKSEQDNRLDLYLVEP